MEKNSGIIKYCLTALIRGYQRFISPLLPPRCRFYPSCSQYAIDALKQHRTHYALYLIIRRLGRCHPLSEGGYDPVPTKNMEK
ncbi:MAG: membrane protein insertion efficiency factor YidD [Pseudomonadota bacterium]